MSQCLNCKQLFRCHTSKVVACNEVNHYATNVGAVLAQIATGSGARHLEEQLSVLLYLTSPKRAIFDWSGQWYFI